MTVENVGLFIYYDDGDSQQWIQTNGAGELVTPPTPPGPTYEVFHDPAGLKSWSILDDTLECWGQFQAQAGGEETISFPKTFADQDFTTTFGFSENGNTRAYTVGESNPRTTSSIAVKARRAGNDTAGDDVIIHWRVIGKWDGAS